MRETQTNRKVWKIACISWYWADCINNYSFLPQKGKQTKNLHQRAGRLKTTITENFTNLITWTTALSNSMKLWAMPCRTTQDGQVMVESSTQNVVHWIREWQTTSVFLPREPHEQYEKTKRYNTERWTPQVGWYPIRYWEKSGEITPERMKRQSQRENNTQLWMWLVMEVKSNAVKIAILHGNLEF